MSSTMYDIPYLDNWMQFVEQNTEFFWDKLERTSYARIIIIVFLS